ncbi:MAG: ribonuclease HII [Rhodospirillaceae bacterium]
MPDLSRERALGAAAGRLIGGVDEVGRGPLAGPVVAAAVILPAPGLPRALAARINDSKALSRKTRDALDPGLREHALAFAIGVASVAEIDSLNILQASLLAMERAVAGLGRVPDHLLIDGNKVPKRLPCGATAVVKGDSLSLSIAAASILAKVFRDNEMDRLAESFPQYGWARNAGYPTAEHRAALLRHGASPHHRTSFGPVREVLSISR